MNALDLAYKIMQMFSGLHFDSQRHLYFVEGINHPSVSSRVDTHVFKVDFDKKIIGSARKEGVTVPVLRERWDKAKIDGQELGTNTHDFLEHFTGIETPTTLQEQAGIQFFKDILRDYEIIVREIRMYSRKYQYAGTSDLLLRHKNTGKLYIADYKTNKDLFTAYENLRPPFQFFEASNYNKYQIQLSYYQIMLEEAGFPIAGRMLIHLKLDGSYRIYDTIDLTDELKGCLEPKIKAHDNHW